MHAVLRFEWSSIGCETFPLAAVTIISAQTFPAAMHVVLMARWQS